MTDFLIQGLDNWCFRSIIPYNAVNFTSCVGDFMKKFDIDSSDELIRATDDSNAYDMSDDEVDELLDDDDADFEFDDLDDDFDKEDDDDFFEQEMHRDIMGNDYSDEDTL